MLSASAKSLLGTRRTEWRPLQYIPAFVSPAAIRHSSLSAIHRGLRRSEKFQFEDSRFSKSRDFSRPSRRENGLDRSQKALNGVSSIRQRQKLHKKLDRRASAAEDEKNTGRQTRRKRFLDPSSSFGKRSLVYHLKHGALKDAAAALDLQEPVRPRQRTPDGNEPPRHSGSDKLASHQRKHDFQELFRQRRWTPNANEPPRRGNGDRLASHQPGHDLQEPVRPRRWTPNANEPPRRSNGDKVASRQPRHDLQEPVRPRQRTYDDNEPPRRSSDDRPASHQPRHDLQEPVRPRRWTPNGDDLTRRSDCDVPNSHRPGHDQQREHGRRDPDTDITDDGPARPNRQDMMPVIITYTTAASQFLYGKSVVKAALEQGRRRVYKLYVYGGENRRDSKDNDTIINLAKLRGVPITTVPNEEQRLMDKMSMGRPHNGLVLEASPLPQLPVRSLGQLEETLARMGFHVQLDHQSAEQRSINGEDTFVRKARNSASKPLVLLLHEILDPGNLGAMLRTASYMGIDAVGITSRGSSNITPIVLKSAAGAAEEVTIFTVNSPVDFLQDSRAMGWKTYSAVAPPEKKLVMIHGDKFISTGDIERTRPLDEHPCILVLGNEGYGLPRPIKVATEFELSVPKFAQGSSVDSLNVSVAAGLLCQSFVKESAVHSVRKEAGSGSGSRQVDQREKPCTVESGEKLF